MSGWYIAAFAGWLLLAAAVSVWMGRRGHSSFGWAVVVGALGPFALPIVWSAVRRERDTHLTIVRRGTGGTGPVDVLIGVDGSEASEAALAFVCDTLGERIGQLHLATVIDYDQGELGGRSAAVAAQAELDALALTRPERQATLVVLVGKPAEALVEYAAQAEVDLIAVGSRGAGRTPALLGSTAERLTRESPVPVLLGAAVGHAVRHQPVDVVTAARSLGAA